MALLKEKKSWKNNFIEARHVNSSAVNIFFVWDLYGHETVSTEILFLFLNINGASNNNVRSSEENAELLHLAQALWYNK